MSVDELRAALATPQDRLTACWTALDLCLRTADAVVWEEGVDGIQALVAADRCASARELLPSSAAASPLDVTPLPPLDVCAGLLDHVRAALGEEARVATDPAHIAAWYAAADHVAAAAIALRGLRRAGT
ncbi:hypothetical protein [Streptomyces rhizosphaericus]|uniref:hypothetical protein n=1 Tax=Streptomyces rhizosphaericus TaxID=114699 RepID=UPI000A3C3120|nr:hypothetical protein [Streptomyces rhizosphaericus]